MVEQPLRYPTFFILGAMKAGTTWLHAVLENHPELGFGWKKELHFFDKKEHFERGPAWYAEQFAHNDSNKTLGDATPKYFFMVHPASFERDPAVPQNAILNLKELCPNPKFIVLLREPVQRALSHHYMRIKNRHLKITQNILKPPPELDMLSPGRYAEQLEIWFDYFPRENFLIMFYEEALNSPEARAATVKRVCEFLEVSSDFVPTNLDEPQNARMSDFEILTNNLFRSYAKYFNIVPKWIQNLSIWKIKVSAADLEYLKNYYVEPNKQLAKLLGRELPW